MNTYYAGVAERAGHRCEYCHAPEAIFNLPFEVEHIVPTSRDGPDDESNQALACRACNQAASHRQQQQPRDGRSEVGSIVLTWPRNSGKENRYNRETFQMEPCG